MSNIEELETDLKAMKEDIRRYDLLKELMDNKAFKELILDGFIEFGSTNATSILEHESTKDKDIRRQYKHQRIASGVLSNFLDSIRIVGNDAESGVEYVNKMIEQERYGDNVSEG